MKSLRSRSDLAGQVYVQHRVLEYRRIWEAVAQEIGAEFRILSQDLWELELVGRRMRVLNDVLELDNPVTLEVAGRKPLVYRLLAQAGLRVPEHVVVGLDSLAGARDFVERHSGGCVVKPANGTSSGMGITTHVRSRRELARAAVLASLYCPEILVEPQVAGECYRLLVLRGEVIHAVRRTGVRIVGDGRATVDVLLERENATRRSSARPLVTIDRDLEFALSSQTLRRESVLPAGRIALVKYVGSGVSRLTELRTVYTEDVTQLVGDSLRRDAETAARTIGSEFVGVDFIATDPEAPLSESGGVINELNTTPGLHHHYFGA
jgi:cyanophycin synthetase